MIPRHLTSKLLQAARLFPVVSLTGPRQSGKTTLVRDVFKDYHYASLEMPDLRRFALEDPRGFLAQFDGPVILDEVQRVPDLFSYIQGLVDEHPDRTGRFILTGSHNFLLLQSISQSLAGRCAVLHLLPFSWAEISRRNSMPLEGLGKSLPGPCPRPEKGLFDVLFTGFYPAIHARDLPPQEWLAAYYQTYVERDVRTIVNVGDVEAFGRFVRLCAGRCGQVLSLSSLANDCGISHTTARRWLSVLEASFIITLLRPYHKNFGKRLIKSPKLYFLDTGLLCFVLQIRTPEELWHRSERGAVFESFVVSELLKNFVHRGERPALSFWRDAAGREVDVVVERGDDVTAVEAKSAMTVVSDLLRPLQSWRNLTGMPDAPCALIYGGDDAFRRSGVVVYPWWVL
uniref:ATP-binding protein n=1 Tax=Desulfacinum infernum TaxID=35837 RepID=A0A832EBC0_9BACT